MVGEKLKRAPRSQRSGSLKIIRPTLKNSNAGHRAAHGSTHALPRDGWTRVQNHALTQLRYGISCRHHIDQDRFCRQHSVHGLRVGFAEYLSNVTH